MADTTLVYLMKQHSRTEYITFVFLQILCAELGKNEAFHSYLHNAVHYVHQNMKIFNDLMKMQNENISKNKDTIKKEGL